MPYTKLYTLSDPETGEVRYVGKTIKSLPKRLAQHMYAAKNGKPTHRDKWIRSLISKGLKPIAELIEEVSDAVWEEREMFWIAEYRKTCGLTNHSDGGGINRPKSGQDNHKARYSAEEVRQAVVLYTLGCTREQVRSLEPFHDLSDKTLRSWAQKEARVDDTLGIPTRRSYRALSK